MNMLTNVLLKVTLFFDLCKQLAIYLIQHLLFMFKVKCKAVTVDTLVQNLL